MLYVQLDTNWPDNHKIIDAGIDGAGLHAIVLCLAKRLEDNGWVRRRLLYRQGAQDELIDRLVALRLLETDDGGKVRPWGWLDRNPSQAAIDARRATKAEAGRRGNHDRWHAGVPYESCQKCQVIAGSDPTRSHESSTAIAPDPIATSRVEGEVTPAIATATLLPDEQIELNRQHRQAIRSQHPFLSNGAAAS